MYKTVRQVADELSLSRQAIHQAIDKVLDKEKIKKKGNAYQLNTAEQQALYDFFSERIQAQATSKNVNDLTSALQSQVDFLLKEIENKNKQISELHILLLKDKDTKLLTDPEEEQPPDEHQEKPEEPRRKWYDIFKIKR